MLYCFIVSTFLLFSISGTSHATCSNTTICVASGNNSSCQHHHHVIPKLSDLTVYERSCANIQIYMTSGIHILEDNLVFSNSLDSITIQGVSNGQLATIQCLNNSGVNFGEQKTPKRTLLANIVLTYCQVRIPQGGGSRGFRTALFFISSSYIMLNNVVVENTNGNSIAIRNSTELSISNCTFANSSREHIKIITQNGFTANVSINRTEFYDGKSKHVSGGLYIVLDSKVSSTIRISHCNFHKNTGVAGSHMLIRSRTNRNSKTRKIDVKIENSTFTNGTGSPGVVIDSEENRQGRFFATFTRSNFSNNELGALLLTTVMNSRMIIEECILSDSYGINGDCSVLEVGNVTNLTLRDVTIANNYCTGIKLVASTLTLSK